VEGISSTDSIGTQSDTSGYTTVPGRPRMDVACVLDLQQPEHLAQRKKALDEVRQACNLVNANIHHIQVSFDLNNDKNRCIFYRIYVE